MRSEAALLGRVYVAVFRVLVVHCRECNNEPVNELGFGKDCGHDLNINKRAYERAAIHFCAMLLY